MVKFFHLHKKVLGFMIFPKTKSLIFFQVFSLYFVFWVFANILLYTFFSYFYLCIPVILYTCWLFFAHIFVFLHFYKYQYWLWTFSKQKKTLWLCTPPHIHSQWFTWLSTSNLAILHWMLDNSQTPPYSATYTFSPTTVSLQHLFSTNHFFGKYSMFIPLTKNTDTAWRMAS